MTEEDFLDAECQLDIGISTPDAQSIKATLLAAIREGHLGVGETHTLAGELIQSFKDIDNEVFARDEMESAIRKRLTAEEK